MTEEVRDLIDGIATDLAVPDVQTVHARAETRQKRRSATTRAATFAVAALLVGVAAIWATRADSEQIVASAGSSAEVENALAVDPATAGSDAVAFLQADATDAEIGEVIALLEASDSLIEFSLRDREEVYEDFRAFFEDDPELLAAISEESLPTTIEFSFDQEELDVLEAVESLPQVRSVVTSTESIRAVQAAEARRAAQAAPNEDLFDASTTATVPPPEGVDITGIDVAEITVEHALYQAGMLEWTVGLWGRYLAETEAFEKAEQNLSLIHI